MYKSALITSNSVTSYATIIIIRFEITANGEIHTNKPKKPAVCTSDKMKADLAEAKAGRGASEEVSAVRFRLGSGLFGSYNSD